LGAIGIIQNQFANSIPPVAPGAAVAGGDGQGVVARESWAATA